jgi:electron transfer flavoprotein alpha subunit
MSVLLYIQNFNGIIKKQTLELASYASSIACASELKLIGVVLGEIDNSQLEKLAAYGVSKIIKANNAQLNLRINKIYTEVIEQAVNETNAEIIIFPDNNLGKAVAPRLSVRLKAGFVPGVVSLPSSYEPFIVSKRAFSGKAYANVKVCTQKKIVSLMNNTFGLHQNPTEITIEEFQPTFNSDEIRNVEIERKIQNEHISLFDADIVVSGGRGIKDAVTWAQLEEFAGILGAAKACSRPVSEDGVRPHSEHVGQTGTIIAPNIYFAFGISGAIQHMAGVIGSKCIVAINTDSEAPIFQLANYGIVGDAASVLPKLIAVFKEYKAE